jgi:hypothetical protein
MLREWRCRGRLSQLELRAAAEADKRMT